MVTPEQAGVDGERGVAEGAAPLSVEERLAAIEERVAALEEKAARFENSLFQAALKLRSNPMLSAMMPKEMKKEIDALAELAQQKLIGAAK